MASQLALLGGSKAVKSDPGNMFDWPIITPEIEAAVLEVLRAGRMSGLDVTLKLEEEYAAWHGMKYALAHNTGTAALHGAMFGLGIGRGDEVICPSITYWASCLPVYSLGGTVVFADIDPDTLCIDPNDIEHRISERTKAIIVVHYEGYPGDMDPILGIARRHKIAVIEDCSHAHGALYKGRLVGTMGDVSGFSMMSGKSFATGEGGIMLTNDRRIYERAMIFGHYERANDITLEELAAGAGLPWGGYKYRMHQLTSAVAREQIKKYPQEMAEIDKAMNYFCDLLEGVPGIKNHRPPKGSGSTMGGWYAASALYRPEELGGLSVYRFCQAVNAEGAPCSPGCNKALHLHPLFNTIDVYNQGRPTRIANLPQGVDIRQPKGSLPVSEGIQERVMSIPWFKHYRPAIIEEYANAFRKVAENYKELLPGDPGNPPGSGSWGLTRRRGG
ncbi:MAG: DegT/DnrJ/EryC1/StrS family aminotransferase [Anaerolineae bacterium]